MRTVVLASLRTHTRRYVAAALAVVIGVAFVVTTAGLSSASRDGLTRGVSAPYEGADVVVTGLSGDDAAALVATAADHDAHASVLGWSVQDVRLDGRRLDELDEVAELSTTPSLRWQELVDGRYAGTPGEAVVDSDDARRDGVEVGDELVVGDGRTTLTVRVVGLVHAPTHLVASDVYVLWSDLAPFAPSLYVDSVAWAGPTDPITDAVPYADVEDATQHVVDLTAEINRGVDVIAILLLLFASIALFVSVLVIANTFSILFAQRQRDLALLRCVGATRKQVLRSVRLEALVLGVVASATGLVAGTAFAHLVVAVVNDRFPTADLGTATISPSWYVGGAVTGLLVTLVSSWLPTRAVTRVSPLAALRPDTGVDVRTTPGRVRIALGVVAVLLGVALLALSVVSQVLVVMLAGGIVSFSGLLLLGPVIVPRAIAGTGRLTSRVLGTTGRLATGNAVRNPRRTAATTASLLVGVTLTTAVLTGMASARGAVAVETDRDHPLDATLTSSGTTLPADAADIVRAVEGVDAVLEVAGVRGRVSRLGELQLLALPAGSDLDRVARGDGAGLTPVAGQILLPYDALDGGNVPGQVTVTVGDRSLRLRTSFGGGWGDGAAILAPATLDRLTDDTGVAALWVRADDDTDSGRFSDDLDVVAGAIGAGADGGFAERAYIELQLDVLTGAVVGLLGIAVVIALIGIGNTIGLSVLERAREHALLRALGLTRRQLRVTLALEAVLLSVVATVIGTLVGTSFAWVGLQAMVRPVVPEAPLTLPVGQLAIVVLVAGLAGLLACVLPARRAARVSPAAGLAVE